MAKYLAIALALAFLGVSAQFGDITHAAGGMKLVQTSFDRHTNFGNGGGWGIDEGTIGVRNGAVTATLLNSWPEPREITLINCWYDMKRPVDGMAIFDNRDKCLKKGAQAVKIPPQGKVTISVPIPKGLSGNIGYLGYFQ